MNILGTITEKALQAGLFIGTVLAYTKLAIILVFIVPMFLALVAALASAFTF